MKPLLFSCISVLLFTAAHAQVSFGPEVGVNMSSYYGKYAGIKQTNISAVPGGRFGGMVDVGMGDHMSVQPGIFYAMNGYKLVASGTLGTTYTFKFNVSTMELPMNLFYKTGTKNDNRFFFGGGPYAGINLGGKITSDIIFGGNRDVTVGSDSLDYIKRLDVGLGISAGYRLVSGLFIHVHFQNSLINLQPQGDADNSMINRNYGISIGYLFGRHVATDRKAVPAKKH